MIEIKVINHGEYLDQTLDLFRLVFHENTAKNWSWRHLGNPFAEGPPKAVIATDGGRLIGARCFLPINFIMNGQIIRAAQSCDSMVHPDFRKSGIFSKMVEAAEKHCRDAGYSFSFGFPNHNSMPVYLRLGWKQVKWCDRVDLPLNLRRLLEKLVPGLPFKKMIGNVYVKFINRKFLDQITSANEDLFEVSDTCPEIMGDVTGLYNHSEFELNRSKTYLQWRIDGNPTGSFKYVYSCDHHGFFWYTIVGHDHQEKHGLKIGQLFDFKVRHDKENFFNDAMLASARVLANDGCDAMSIIGSFGKQFQKSNLRKLGFWRITNYYKIFTREQRLPRCLIVKPLLISDPIFDPLDSSKWYPTRLYSDA